MARHLGVSKATVQRVWSTNDIKPHRTRIFKLSCDEQFEAKFWDVIGVYLNPPDNAVVLCCDEKSQCQALQRSQPGLPLAQGHIRTVTHDYYRHGTVTLFAALDYLSGKVISQVAPRRDYDQTWSRTSSRRSWPQLDRDEGQFDSLARLPFCGSQPVEHSAPG